VLTNALNLTPQVSRFFAKNKGAKNVQLDTQFMRALDNKAYRLFLFLLHVACQKNIFQNLATLIKYIYQHG